MANTKNHDDAPDGPTPEQLRRHRYEPVKPDKGDKDSALRDARGALRRVDGTVLDALRARKLISAREWTAGDRLRQDFYGAGLEPRVTATYEAVIPGGRGVVSDARMDAETRWRRAVMGVGSTVASVLVALIVEDVGPTDIARIRWGYASSRSAKSAGVAAVRLSLDVLADFYQMEGA